MSWKANFGLINLNPKRMTITDQPPPTIDTTVVLIATSLIAPDPEQPRKEFLPEEIEHLGQAIKKRGLLQPITVRPNPSKPDNFLIVMGERRWRAHCHAGLQTVRCLVTSGSEDAARRFLDQTAENMARQKMTLMEESNAAQRMTDLGLGDDEIATGIGLSVSRMRNIRRMSMLSPIVWSLLNSGAINPAVAEWVMGNVKADAEIEPLLVRLDGKTRSQAALIADAFVAEKNQDTFMLACDEAGVTTKKDDLAKQMAVLLMHAATVIAKLSIKDQAVLAREIGATIAKMSPRTKEIERGALFIGKAMTTVCASE